MHTADLSYLRKYILPDILLRSNLSLDGVSGPSLCKSKCKLVRSHVTYAVNHYTDKCVAVSSNILNVTSTCTTFIADQVKDEREDR